MENLKSRKIKKAWHDYLNVTSKFISHHIKSGYYCNTNQNVPTPYKISLSGFFET